MIKQRLELEKEKVAIQIRELIDHHLEEVAQHLEINAAGMADWEAEILEMVSGEDDTHAV